MKWCGGGEGVSQVQIIGGSATVRNLFRIKVWYRCANLRLVQYKSKTVRLNKMSSSPFHVLHGASLHLRCNISPYVTTRSGGGNCTVGAKKMHMGGCIFFTSRFASYAQCPLEADEMHSKSSECVCTSP